MTREKTHEEILKATEGLLSSSATLDEISVRRIARIAGVNISAISYHFGSREALIAKAIHRIYHRFNAERLNRLQAALDAFAPVPPSLSSVLAALVEPSIRWSFDPNSGYPAFTHFAVVTLNATDPTIRNAMADNVEHLRPFISVIRQLCPWFSEGEIGWRIHCLLGIRHNAVRYRERARVLIDNAFDLSDPDDVLKHVLDVAEPMFRAPKASN
jgi:AcrR family transcriptional regulator